jgi:hypothetical protein
MNYDDITQTVKKKLNVLVVNQLSYKSQSKIIYTEVFSNRIKLYNFFNGLGTCYAKKMGNQFKRPLLTYKTFTEYIRSGDAVYIHVASTGVFSGSYLVQIITVK